MLAKTHLSIGIFAIVFFLPHINHKFIFIPVVLIASILPDIDSGFSTLKKNGFGPLRFLGKRRGIFHSFSFCILVSFLLAFFIPVLAFSFFLGYALHLLADSWTPEGIKPFWPFGADLKGNVKVGGVVEESVFIVFVILDLMLLVLLFL